MIGRLGAAAREIVYPRRCAGCGARGSWACELCRKDLELFDPPWCAGCGVPLRLGGCRCGDLPSGVIGARAVGPFAGWLRGAIVALKYDDEADRAAHLAALMAERIADLAPRALLVPVPLHPSRERQRGYNQSALIADGVAAALGWERIDPLRRSRATGQQAKLGAAARQSNVAGAFVLATEFDPVRLAGETVVLVDDVLTTGATVGECAGVLASIGPGRICVATLARDL